MIIEVNDNTGQAVTYNSVRAFVNAHSVELDEIYKKKYAPEIDFDLWNRVHLENDLPEGAGKIVRITSHTSYIVCMCENGEVYSFNRTGEYPYFKIDIKSWQK